MIVKTACQRDIASRLGKKPTPVCAESHKVGFIVSLQMRKIAPIKTLKQKSLT